MFRKLIYIFLLCLTASSVRAQDNASEKAPAEAAEVREEKLIDAQSLIKELREKEKALNAREADLNAREARLDTLQKDILDRENDLKKMRQEVSDRLEELKGAEDEELDKLAKIYSSAKPKSAAAIFVKMDLEKAVAVFRKMTPSAAGKILNEMGRLDPAYASKLSEGLTPRPVFTEQ